jgi:putative endonuclease
MLFHVYILRSEKDKSFYIGHTSNLQDRLKRHNEGRSQYTKSRGPWTLVYSEKLESRAAASRRERELKALKNRKCILDLIQSG